MEASVNTDPNIFRGCSINLIIMDNTDVMDRHGLSAQKFLESVYSAIYSEGTRLLRISTA